MIAPRNIAASFTGGGRFALDVPVAALAGLSVAFLVFAMPGDTLAELVGSTGLASIVSAAEPPLGVKARIAIGAAGAVAVFAAAFLMLRWLDRLGTRSDEDGEPETEAPRLRRRDFHPDAPPRPPLMATWELGEPDYARPAETERPEPAPPESFEASFEAPESQDEWLLDEPVRFGEPATEPLPPPTEASPVAAPLDAAAPAAAATPLPTPAAAPAPAPAPAPAQYTAAPGSLDELMARLEQGLARRRVDAPAAPMPAEPAARSAPTPFPEAADDRLQSAIDSLQRLAARGD